MFTVPELVHLIAGNNFTRKEGSFGPKAKHVQYMSLYVIVQKKEHRVYTYSTCSHTKQATNNPINPNTVILKCL